MWALKKDQFLQCLHKLLELIDETKTPWLHGIGTVTKKLTTDLKVYKIWQRLNIWP